MDDSSEWSLWTGTQMERSRREAGLSLAKLADRCRDLGVPIHRIALGKIEAGDRTPTVDEIAVLAIALNTSPVMLLFGPQLAEGPVEVLPGLRTAAMHALRWFSGMEPITEDSAGAYRRSHESLQAVRHLMEARALIPVFTKSLHEAIAQNGSPERIEAAQSHLALRQEMLDDIERDVRDRGLILDDDASDT
jgi:transcriptional regulator with XRE-family HTH domain